MSDSTLIDLYSGRILELAADIPRTGRLPSPQGTATKRAPLCGSNVTVDVRLSDGRIAEFAQDVRACALGQAAASVVGRAAPGLDRAAVARARDQLAMMLKDDGPAPEAPFADLGVLVPARAFPNRHQSILLALDATLAAMTAAETAACA